MRAHVGPRASRIGVMWLGIQAVWSALLGVELQSRVSILAPEHAVATYAWLAGGGAALAAVVQVVAGHASDRRLRLPGNRHAFYAFGIALATIGLATFFAAGTLALLAAGLVLIQLGLNVASGPYQAAIPDAFPADTVGRASAWMGGYSFAGSLCGLIVAAALPRLPAGAVLAGLLIASTLVTLAHLRRLPPVTLAPQPLHITNDIATVLVSRGCINVGFYTLFGFLFFFVHDTLHVADARTTTGLLFIAFTIAGIAGAALAGKPADRYDKRDVVGVAAVAIGIAVAIFAAAPNLPVAFVAATASGFAWGAFFTADWAIAYAVLPRNAMATAMGVWNLAAAVPQIVAPAITAPLVAALDARSAGLGPRVALALVVVEFAAGALLLRRLPALAMRARPEAEL